MRMRLAVLTGAVALVAAAPAGAATKSVNVAEFAFSPSRVEIAQGDRVDWRFTGPEFNHSVTSDPPGQAESFDSDPQSQPGVLPGFPFPFINHPGGNYVFSHTFSKTGTFSYYCKVHDFMRGSVAVKAGTASGGGVTDTRPPGTRLGGRRRQDIDKLAIRVKLNEAGTVTVTGDVKVRGRRRAFRLRRVKKTLAANDSTRFGLRLRRASKRRVKRSLRRGRRATARVKITSVDRAGNRTVSRKRIRLRR